MLKRTTFRTTILKAPARPPALRPVTVEEAEAAELRAARIAAARRLVALQLWTDRAAARAARGT